MATQLLLPTIVYGTAAPEIRFGLHKGRQVVFCVRNSYLHLDEGDLVDGTYEMGRFLGKLCNEHCVSRRDPSRPCPAFGSSHKVGAEDHGLATVEIHELPKWELCGGVQKVLEVEMTPEERFFFLSYLDYHFIDEHEWRDRLVGNWNEAWSLIEDDFFSQSRAAKFNRMMWRTIRYPAIIPQVWLNWYHAAPEPLLRKLEDGQASRVDFVAFAYGERHVIEIDGPSHYAVWKGHGYEPDEKEYARNLKIARWLESEGWRMTRLGRWEVKQAMGKDGFFGSTRVMDALPFGRKYPPLLIPEEMGLPDVAYDPEAVVFDDDIPF